MWPGAEPTKGNTNQTYLKAIRNITRAAARYGIYTLLDFHQDVLGDRWCGEGVPGWLGDELATVVDKAPWYDGGFVQAFPWSSYKRQTITDYWATPDPVKYNEIPDRHGCINIGNVGGWATGYATPQVMNAFNAMYTNKKYTDYWANYWATAAEYFKGEPQIVGLSEWLAISLKSCEFEIKVTSSQNFIQKLLQVTFVAGKQV